MKVATRNLSGLAIGDVASRLLGFAATTYLARTLRPDGFGMASIGLAVLGYLMLLGSPGIHVYGTRQVSQKEKSDVETVREVSGTRMFLALALVVLLGGLGLLLWPGQLLSSLVILYSFSLIPIALFLDWFYQGKERMSRIGWSRVLLNAVYLMFLVLFVRHPTDILRAPVAFLLGNVVSAMVFLVPFFRAHKRILSEFKPLSFFLPSSAWFQVIKRSLPFGIGIVLGQLSINFGPIIVGVLSTVADAAYFSAALRVVFFLMILDRLVATLLLPAIARYQKESPDRVEPLLSFVLKIILVLATPICVGGVLVADRVIVLLYGPEFSAAIPALQWLVWYFFFSIASSVYVFGLIGIGQELRYMRMMTYGTLVQLAMMTVLSLLFSVNGAAAGYALGESVILGLMIMQFKDFRNVHLWPALWKPLLAASVMGAVVYFTRELPLFYTIPMGAGLFLVVLVGLGGLTRSDFFELRTRLL